jgi:hypothetical protein
MEMTRGSAVRLVISQPEPALYIQVPMFETSVAVHSTVKTRRRNGLHDEEVTLFCTPP